MSATSGDIEVTNPDERERLRAAAEQEVKSERRDEREALSLKARIEQNLASETVTLPVGDEPIEFDTFGRETSEWAAVLQERIRRLEGDNFEAEFSEEIDRIYRTLAGYSEPSWMTRGWWEDYCGVRRAIQYITSINAEQEITEEDIKNSQRRT